MRRSRAGLILTILLAAVAGLFAGLWLRARDRCRRAESVLAFAAQQLASEHADTESVLADMVMASVAGVVAERTDAVPGGSPGARVFEPGNLARARRLLQGDGEAGARFVALSARVAAAQESGKDARPARAALAQALHAAVRGDLPDVRRSLDRAETEAGSLRTAYPRIEGPPPAGDREVALRRLLGECDRAADGFRQALCEGSPTVDRLLLVARHCLASGKPELGFGPAEVAAAMLGVRPIPGAPGSVDLLPATDLAPIPPADAEELVRLLESAETLSRGRRAAGLQSVPAEALLDDARRHRAEGRSGESLLLVRSALALLGFSEQAIARDAGLEAAAGEEP